MGASHSLVAHSHQTPRTNATDSDHFPANCENHCLHSLRTRAPVVPADGQNVLMDLGRIAWIATVLVCVVTAAILLFEGYYGYAGVTIAVAASAFINLF